MKLAISTWSFQQRLASGAMTQMDCISKAKELGADAIEFVDVLPRMACLGRIMQGSLEKPARSRA